MTLRVGSLFSGIGGLDLGLERAGMTVVWQVENDRSCIRVLQRHWPEVKRYGDIRALDPDELAAVDLVCGGFPCQDLSVAGRRAGLAGARSGLFWEFMRIAHAVAAPWLLLENVPGLLSSNKGEDFATLLEELAGWRPAVPEGGWRNAGIISGMDLRNVRTGIRGPLRREPARRGAGTAGMSAVWRGTRPAYCVAWRVLDSQYFGVAQRRRRVFIVASAGGRSAAQVLFEPESCERDTPPCREARAELARDVAASLRGGGGSPRGWHNECESGLAVTPLLEVGARTSGDGYRDGDGIGQPGDPMYTLQAGKQHGVAVAFDPNQVTSRTNRSNPQPGQPCHALPAQGNAPIVAATLNSGGNSGGFRTEPGEHLVVGPVNSKWAKGTGGPAGDECQNLVAPALCGSQEGGKQYSNQWIDCWKSAMSALGLVRRLTPRECERLQGLPDDWTAVDGDRTPDSPRYRGIGNAVTATVASWIGRRLMRAAREGSP